MLLPLLPSFSAGGPAGMPANDFFTQGLPRVLSNTANHRLVTDHANRGRPLQLGAQGMSWRWARPRLTVKLRGRLQRRRRRAARMRTRRVSSRSPGLLRLTRARRPRRRVNRLLRVRAARSWHKRWPATAPARRVGLRYGRTAPQAKIALRGH
jgi:hypothetical protein